MKDLLLVVDMQKVYEENEPWGCPGMQKACRQIRKLLDSGKAWDVIFTVFTAPKEPVGTWKEYNREYAKINADKRLNEMTDDLVPYTKRYPVYEKSAYSSYCIAQVREAAAQADRVLVSGVVAECCILATVESLIDAGVKVIYLKDAVAGQTPEFEAIVEKIVESFSTMHTELMTVEEYVNKN